MLMILPYPLWRFKRSPRASVPTLTTARTVRACCFASFEIVATNLAVCLLLVLDTVHADGPRVPADEIEGLDAATDGNYVNPEDATNGKYFVQSSGLASLRWVPIGG